MSEFDDPKKRVLTPTQPTFRHHHRRKTASSAPAKGALAAHNALDALPPDRHPLALGKPLLTYRDVPPAPARAKGSSIEPPLPSLEEMEATMPPQTVGSTLRDYLRAAKELLKGH